MATNEELVALMDRALEGKDNRAPYQPPSMQDQIASYQSSPRRAEQMNMMNELRGGHQAALNNYERNKTDLRTMDGRYGSPVTLPGQGGGTPGNNRYQTNPYTGTSVGNPGTAPPSDYQQARQRQIYQDDFEQKYGFSLYKPESHNRLVMESSFDPHELQQGQGYNTVTKPENPMHNNYQTTGYPINPNVPDYRYPVPDYGWYTPNTM